MTLTDTWVPKAPPLRVDAVGAIRIGSSRVTLPVLMAEYKQGLSAEEIAKVYDTLDLADIHAVISYYLHNRAKVDAYLAEVESESTELRKKTDSDPAHQELVDRMRRRWADRQETSK